MIISRYPVFESDDIARFSHFFTGCLISFVHLSTYPEIPFNAYSSLGSWDLGAGILIYGGHASVYKFICYAGRFISHRLSVSHKRCTEARIVSSAHCRCMRPQKSLSICVLSYGLPTALQISAHGIKGVCPFFLLASPARFVRGST